MLPQPPIVSDLLTQLVERKGDAPLIQILISKLRIYIHLTICEYLHI